MTPTCLDLCLLQVLNSWCCWLSSPNYHTGCDYKSLFSSFVIPNKFGMDLLVVVLFFSIIQSSLGHEYHSTQNGLGPCTLVQQGEISGDKTCGNISLKHQETSNSFLCACNSSSSTPQLGNIFYVASGDVGRPSFMWYNVNFRGNVSMVLDVIMANQDPQHHVLNKGTTTNLSSIPLPATIEFAGSVDFLNERDGLMEIRAGYSLCVSLILSAMIETSTPSSWNSTISTYLSLQLATPFQQIPQKENVKSRISIVDGNNTKHFNDVPACKDVIALSIQPVCREGTIIITNIMQISETFLTCDNSSVARVFLAASPSAIDSINVTTVTEDTVTATWVKPFSGGCAIDMYNVSVFAESISQDQLMASKTVRNNHVQISLSQNEKFSHDSLYYIVVTACSQAGCSNPSEQKFFSNKHTKKSVPVTLIAASVGAGASFCLLIGIAVYVFRNRRSNCAGYAPIQ